MESVTNYKTFEDDKKSIDDKISMLERYVLADNKEDFFNSLVFNSDTYLYMKLNDALNNGKPIDDIVPGGLEAYFKDVENSLKLEILFKDLALKIPKEQDPEKRKILVDRFNREFLSLGFVYNKPAQVKKTEGITAINQEIFTNSLTEEQTKPWTRESIFEKYYTTPEKQTPNIASIKPTSYIYLDLEKVANLNFDQFLQVLKSLPHYYNCPNIVGLLIRKQKERVEKFKSFFYPAAVYTKLDLKMLTEYMVNYPDVLKDLNFVTTYYTKAYDTPVTKDMTTIQKVNCLKKIFAWAEALPEVHNSLAHHILREIANICVKEKHFDEDVFFKCLNMPSYPFHFTTQEFKEKIKNFKLNGTGTTWSTYTGFKTGQWLSEEDVINKYLKHYFKTRDYSEFTSLFDETWIRKKYLKFKLQQGEKFNNITENFTEIELNTLRDKKELRVTKMTETLFREGDPVKITLKMKNIQHLQVSIYEIDTFSYYKKRGSDIDAKMNLSGVIPSSTFKKEYKHPPIVKFKETFEFDELTARKRGVFIVEFVGDGLSTRGLIKKGNLNIVRDSGHEGHLFYILDEKKQVCTSPDTKLHLLGEVYKASATGQIFVPFMNQNISVSNAIIESDGFSQLCNIDLVRTDIVFDTSLIFNEESLESGKTATFIIQPKLFAYNRLIPVNLLKDGKVIITSKNQLDVRHSKVMEGVKFQEGEDFVVDYMVPSKTVEIQFEIKGSVTDKATGTDVPLTNTRKITITRRDDKDIFYDFFLKPEDEGYKIRLVGKNGEVYPGYQIRVNMWPQEMSTQTSVTLETNSDGEINLGKLEGIWQIAATLKTAPSSYTSVNKTWVIDSQERFKNFPEEFDILEGEDLRLPAYGNTCTRQDYSLIKTDMMFDSVKEDKFSCIQKEGDVVYLSGLPEGYYLFYYNSLRDTKKVSIRVHKGDRWTVSNQYLLKENQIIKLMNQSNYLTYTDLKRTSDELQLNILSNDMDSVKVHVLGYNYFPDHVANIMQSLKGNCVTEKSEITYFAENYSEFYSEKELSDELKYVIERKGRPTFMGNTLEKPSGLLKRHFNRKTQADKESLNTEKQYQHTHLTNDEGVKNRKITCTRFERRGPVSSFALDLMNSYLQERGAVVANASVDPDGLATVDMSKFSNLSTALVIIEDKNNCLCEIITLGSKEPVKKDLRLENSREANKVYLHERTAHNLVVGQTLNILDLNNTEMMIVDQQSTLLELLKLVSGRRDLDEWDFLKRWDIMDSAEKLKKYDKYISHELHLFTFFKDKEFFEMVVRAHIQNKNEKTFLDYFLLGDLIILKQYLDKVNVHQLNIIEQALLIYALKDKYKEQCTKLYELLQMIYDTAAVDLKKRHSLFDTVLKSGESKDGPKDKEGRGAHTMATSFTNSNSGASSVPGMKGTYGQITQLSNVKFSKKGQNYNIKENRGGSKSFRTMGVTDEFVERDYYFADADNLEVTQFWLDFIKHILSGESKAFLTDSFIESARSNVEMLAVLSVLDLQAEREEHETSNDQTGFHLTAKQNSIIFCKEIKEKNNERMELDILISQQFFDIFDRTEIAKDGSTKLKRVTDFLPGTLYASRIAITNFSENQYEVTLVSEIPQGSIPVKSLDYLKSTVMTLQPLSTKVNEFLFYFPSPGEYSCYPAAVTKDGCLVCSANIESTIKVHKDRPVKELKTMKDILSGGKTEDILQFMKTQNILDSNVFKFQDIYWLLNDRKFYDEVIKIMEERFMFDETTFSFSIYHGDVPRINTYLTKKFENRRITIRDLDIYFMKNDLFNIDDFKIREYFPLINPRVHDIGEYKHNILNRDFMNTYITFLKYLLDKGNLESKDWLALSVYFLLQDRVDEVLQIFPKIKKSDFDGVELLIQYDYLTAYLDLYTDYPEFKTARVICTDYLTYPIYTWRNKFIDLANQIAEFDGQVELSKIVTEESKVKEQKEAQKQILFEASSTDCNIKIQSRYINQFTVNVYEVDLEVMFSQDPFLESGADTFAFLKPNDSFVINLKDTEELCTTPIEIKEEYKSKNLLIYAIYKDEVRKVTYFPSSMQTFVIENYGQIKVASKDGKPLSKVYVKCFSKATSGGVKFYKDGYTDMRGTFDYASLNLNSQTGISTFALLISSQHNGSLIQKVAPPSEMQKSEGEAMQLKAETWQKKQLEQQFDDIDDCAFGATEEATESKKPAYHLKKNKYWK
jgi:hypothetical protein